MKHLIYKIAATVFRKIQKLLGLPTLGVRAIVLNDKKEVLLVKHSYQSGWFLPGGGVKNEEPLKTAIKRELLEEAGICVTGEIKFFASYVNKMLGAADYPFLFIIEAYSQVESNSSEISEYRWFKYEEIPPTTSPGSQRRLKEYFNNLPPSERW